MLPWQPHSGSRNSGVKALCPTDCTALVTTPCLGEMQLWVASFKGIIYTGTAQGGHWQEVPWGTEG